MTESFEEKKNSHGVSPYRIFRSVKFSATRVPKRILPPSATRATGERDRKTWRESLRELTLNRDYLCRMGKGRAIGFGSF